MLSTPQEVRLPHQVQLSQAALAELVIDILDLLDLLVVLNLIRAILILEDADHFLPYGLKQIFVFDQLLWHALIIRPPVAAVQLLSIGVMVKATPLLLRMPIHRLQMQILFKPLQDLNFQQLIMLIEVALLLYDALVGQICRLVFIVAAISCRRRAGAPLLRGDAGFHAAGQVVDIHQQLVEERVQSLQLQALSDEARCSESLLDLCLKQILELHEKINHKLRRQSEINAS